VTNGDVTQFFFDYGTTTSYGKSTPPGTIGSCPAGVTSPSPYCNVPATQNVSSNVTGLTPCTTYHFRIVASNPDGTTRGGDKSFTTGFANPISKVKSKKRVKRGHRFKVKITLAFTADVKIVIRRHGHAVKTVNLGTRGPGTVSKRIRAPHRRGKYTLRVVAKLSCGTQKVDKKLRVH